MGYTSSMERSCLIDQFTSMESLAWMKPPHCLSDIRKNTHLQFRFRVRSPVPCIASKELKLKHNSMDGSHSHHYVKPRLTIKSMQKEAWPLDPDESLINEDLRPTVVEERSFSGWEMGSLWIGLVVGVPSYYMAGSLVEMGMAWWQGIATVMAANSLLLIPLVMTGHIGTKYGIPFPVACRASFGIKGAHVPTILRGLVGCGWYGIETWIGGQAIYVLLSSLPPVKNWSFRLTGRVIPWLGTSAPEFSCFMVFWVMQILIIWNGMESIRKLEKYSAPILMILCAALLMWAYMKAGGFGRMLCVGSQFVKGGAQEGRFWSLFFPSLTANIGFWATLAINIPDFTRYAKSQADQTVGQVGLPIFMGAFTFLGLAVTSSTEVIFGQVISNPIELLGRINGIWPISLSLLGITLATLTTNIAANVVAPANALVNLSPWWFTFRRGALLTAITGILFQPWRLLQSSESYIYTWLIGYSALLGPIGGIILVDYYILKKCELDINDLYSCSRHGQYWHSRGYNMNALASLLIGMMPVIPGFLQTVGVIKLGAPIFLVLYNNAWFVSFFTAGIVYWFLSQFQGKVPANTLSKIQIKQNIQSTKYCFLILYNNAWFVTVCSAGIVYGILLQLQGKVTAKSANNLSK